MAYTIEELKAIDCGYLTGVDLLRFCSSQLIQKQYNTDEDTLINSVNTAYSEIKSNLSTRYDINNEFTKRGTERNATLVKITAIAAIRNLTGDLAAIPENMTNSFRWLEQTLLEIRNGQMSLNGVKLASTSQISNTSIIQNSFNTLS